PEGEEKPARQISGGALAAAAANRNTCQFRNPRISLTKKDITFSNRNKKPVSAGNVFHVPGLAQSDAAEGSRSTNHESQLTNHGNTIASGANERDNHFLLTPRIQGASVHHGDNFRLTSTQSRRRIPDHR